MSSLPPGLMRARGGFARDPRFLALPAPVEIIDEPEADRVEEAFTRGFAEGARQAGLAAAEAQRERDRHSAAIELAFARFDDDSAAALRERLRETVIALCEATVLPLVLDPVGLAARIERAGAMLRRAQDERRVLLHPDDLALVRHRLPPEMILEGDLSVERGGLRIETPDGGIEDGPGQWRRLLNEAFGL